MDRMQIGCANFFTMVHLDNMLYITKLLIVHINVTFNMKFYLLEASNVRMSSFHNIFNLLIKGYKYTSILFLRLCSSRMIKVKKMLNVVM